MIAIDVLSMRQRTYNSFLSKLSDVQLEGLRGLRKTVIEAITEAAHSGEYTVYKLRIDDFQLLQIIMAELEIKGFKVNANSSTEYPKDREPFFYYEIKINWGF